MVRKYDRELKVEVVSLSQEEGTTATEVERRLGIGKGMISRWKLQLAPPGRRCLPGEGPPACPGGGTAPAAARVGSGDSRARYPRRSSGHLLRGTVVERCRFIAENRTRWGAVEMCRVLGVSRNRYYDWRGDPESSRARETWRLDAAIKRLFGKHKGRVGSPKITRYLREAGWRVD